MGERTPHGPAFPVHVLPPSAPHLDLGGSVQCSNVGLCLNLHPSMGEGFLWSCLLCSRSLSFCFSFGPRELSPVFQCGSLSLSPSIARGRFYGDMQNIHQYGYGPRTVQAPSPPLPRKQSRNLYLGLGTPPKSSLLQTPKWLS